MPMDRGTPDLVRHCVAAVAKQYGGDTSKAFAICVATLQKAGYLKPGTMELTAAGKKKEKEHEAEPDAAKKLKAYEKLLKANRKDEAYATEAKGYKCMECGRKCKRPVEECPKCGSSDIDLDESAPQQGARREPTSAFFDRLLAPEARTGLERLPTTVARRYESVSRDESSMDLMRRLAGITSRHPDRVLAEAKAAGISKGEKGYDADPDKVAAILSKLVVGSGGKAGFADLTADKNFTVTMAETPKADRTENNPYTLTLRYLFKGQMRTRAVPLKKEEVFTKSKSRWARDSVWRLKPETVAKYADQIAKMLTDPRATQAESKGSVQARLAALSERTKFLHSPDGSPENEGEMAKAQLENIADLAQRLSGLFVDEDQLPAWVQDYITSAEQALESVASYIEPKSRKA